MLDQIKKQLREVKISKDYERYIGETPDAYFVSAFIMGNYDEISGPWTIDFYSKEKHKIMSFSVGKSEEGKILQKEFEELKELNLNDVKIDLDEVFETLKKLFEKEYSTINWGKSIIVLQMKEEPLWNITLTTETLEIFNAKISAVSGEIKSHKLEKLIKL